MKDQGHRAERWEENYINLQIPERTSYLSHNTMAFILKAVLYLSVFLCVSGAVIPSDEDTELILVSVVSCKFFQTDRKNFTNREKNSCVGGHS
jgi:hypothetical protein